MNKKAYFAFRDLVVKESSSGYSAIEIHNLAKEYILPQLLDDEDCWTQDVNELSTKYLSERGWKIFLEHFKVFCFDNFKISIF